MEKIPTMYPRDEAKKGHPVMPGVKPECAWVEAGEGIPTRKLDGTNVKIEAGVLFKRQKPKNGQPYDEAAYVAVSRHDPGDKYILEAFDALPGKLDGIYEAVGPKIQGNPEGYRNHTLVRVVPPDPGLTEKGEVPRTFEGLRAYLESEIIEGIVFHHPDGRFAKIKRRDFGLPWPDPRTKDVSSDPG
jgi:hypothetical protein